MLKSPKYALHKFGARGFEVDFLNAEGIRTLKKLLIITGSVDEDYVMSPNIVAFCGM